MLTAVLTRTPVHGVPPIIPERMLATERPKHSLSCSNLVPKIISDKDMNAIIHLYLPVLLSAILAEIRVSKTATKATLKDPIMIGATPNLAKS